MAPHRRPVLGLLRSAPLVPRRRLARPPLLFFSFTGRGRRTRAGTTGDGAGGGSGVGGERGHGSWNIRELGGGGLGPSHGATEGRRRALRLAGELRKQARSEALWFGLTSERACCRRVCVMAGGVAGGLGPNEWGEDAGELLVARAAAAGATRGPARPPPVASRPHLEAAEAQGLVVLQVPAPPRHRAPASAHLHLVPRPP